MMQEWKKILAGISITVFIVLVCGFWIGWGIELEDPEFEDALVWAEQSGIDDIETLRAYPFRPVTRATAAQWYVLLAQDIGLVPGVPGDCVFADIADIPLDVQNLLILSCQYAFFKGTEGNFYPQAYVTKANSLVGLMRGLFPARKFPQQQPYRTPYVGLAHEMGVTHRASGPYLMYLITNYELLLQLYRVHEQWSVRTQ